MPKRIWEKSERGFLSDTAGLISLGIIAFFRGYSYLPMNVNVNRSPAHWLEGLLPTPVWGVIWILIGLLCFVAVFVPRLLPAAVAFGVGVHVLWLLSFIGIQITGENYRAYVTALGYYGTSFFAAWGFGRGRNLPVLPEIKGER